MINRSIPEAYITIINIYASNIGVHQYIIQMEPTILVEIDSNTIKEGDFTNPLTPMWPPSAHWSPQKNRSC